MFFCSMDFMQPSYMAGACAEVSASERKRLQHILIPVQSQKEETNTPFRQLLHASRL